nr:reverse transcriptase domain-containing protein [Tanacetum cinerariifolium]
MSTMANTTPIATTVTKIANKEKTPKEADAALKANILNFYEMHYEDILPVIMDKIRRDKRKEVHARLEFGENPRKSRRVRDGSQNSSDGTLPARYLNPLETPKMRDRLKYNDEDVFDRLGHQRQSVFDRLSNTYSPSITKSGRTRETRGIALTVDDVLADGALLAETVLETETAPVALKNHMVERWAMPTWCHMFNSTLIGAARVWFDELPSESIDGYKGLKADFLAYFMQQKKYVKELVEIHNIKQRDGETIEEFREHFKIETERMKGVPECMRIFGFMHGVNNPELTKRLNEHVPKTVEEMMTATTTFIRGETAAASKKKVHTPWKSHDQTPKEIFVAEPEKFKPPPPMALDKRNPSSTIHGSWNAQVPGILREVYYHDWLSNPVMVMKHDGSWRTCVDFTDLNKACLQACYPLPEIDWKVESLCGYSFKCFLDAYKGYHQIQMAEKDEEKMAFHTSHGVYGYTKIPFGLKNAGATYQRLVDKAFDRQIGQNLEIYVDDLVIKSHTETELLRDIEEMFRTLRKINMKLNPKKCTFGAAKGMFLGYMISPKGIKLPRQDGGRVAAPIPTDNQRGPKPQWEVGWPE